VGLLNAAVSIEKEEGFPSIFKREKKSQLSTPLIKETNEFKSLPIQA
jgi:hypothetical protein